MTESVLAKCLSTFDTRWHPNVTAVDVTVREAAPELKPYIRYRISIYALDGDHTAELSFPNDVCTITDRLVTELTKHMKLSVRVEEKG